MTPTAILTLLLLAPLATTWAVWRGFSGALRRLALLPLAMLVINASAALTDLVCTPGDSVPWGACALPGLAAVSNGLAPVYSWSVLATLTLTPALLILAGIAAMVRREGHRN